MNFSFLTSDQESDGIDSQSASLPGEDLVDEQFFGANSDFARALRGGTVH